MKQSDPEKRKGRTLIDMVDRFCALEGRQPRIMISGQGSGLPGDGAATLAVRLADLGFDVDFGPLCREAPDLYRQALDSDVDVVCLLASTRPDKYFQKKLCALCADSEGQFLLALYLESGPKEAMGHPESGCFEFLREDEMDMGLQLVLERLLQA